ncbi:MAG: alpha/beta fold hydrolase [Candidatus Angelobacter sp.]
MIRPSLVGLASILLAFSCAAQQNPARVIDLTAPDGVKLKATFFASAKPGPGVLLLHQCNRQRKVWDELAQQLASAGINTLTLDLRGFGESGGTPVDKLSPQEAQVQGQKWPGDIDVAFAYLSSQPGVKRDVIGVGGASCGVDNSIQTARRHPKEVKSLVLLSGGTDLAGRQFLREANSLPIFAAVADDDEFRPTVEVMPWLFSLSSNPGKQFVHYATGGHGADIFRVHPELRGKIVDWYVTTLIKTPGHAPAANPAWTAPASAEMLNLMEQPGGVAKVAQKLQDARTSNPKAVLFDEATVNILGYEHFQAGDAKGALEILKLNATAFPESPNVYDSLSDVYIATGEKELARQNANKALELLAADTKDPEQLRNAIRDSAEQKLKQLGPAPQ